MVRVRFAPSPTGSLHVGNALVAAANRRFADELGGELVLRIDDTDPARNVRAGRTRSSRDLTWLGVAWDEGPIRQRSATSDTARRRPARRALRRRDPAARGRHGHLPARERGGRRRPRHHARHTRRRPPAERGPPAPSTRRARRSPPEYLYVGLILRPEGGKLSKRDPLAVARDLRAGASRRGRPRLPRGAGPPTARRPLRPGAHPPASGRGDRRARRRGARGAGGRARRGGPGAPRGAHAERGARGRGRVLDRCPRRSPRARRRRCSASAELRAAQRPALDKAAARELVRELKAVGGDLQGGAARAHRRGRAVPSSGRCSPRSTATRRCSGSRLRREALR